MTFLNEAELFSLHTDERFQEIPSNTDNSIYYKPFIYRQWSGYKYRSLTRIILFQHNSFICTQSNGSEYCYV